MHKSHLLQCNRRPIPFPPPTLQSSLQSTSKFATKWYLVAVWNTVCACVCVCVCVRASVCVRVYRWVWIHAWQFGEPCEIYWEDSVGSLTKAFMFQNKAHGNTHTHTSKQTCSACGDPLWLYLSLQRAGGTALWQLFQWHWKIHWCGHNTLSRRSFTLVYFKDMLFATSSKEIAGK